MAVEQAVQAVANHRAGLDQPLTGQYQSAQFAHKHRRNPHFRDNVCDQQPYQPFEIILISLHARFGDLPHGSGMCHHCARYQRRDDVVDIPTIRGGLDHDRVPRTQIRRCPLLKFSDLDPPRLEGPFLDGIHPTCQHIFFVEVERDASFSLLSFLILSCYTPC